MAWNVYYRRSNELLLGAVVIYRSFHCAPPPPPQCALALKFSREGIHFTQINVPRRLKHKAYLVLNYGESANRGEAPVSWGNGNWWTDKKLYFEEVTGLKNFHTCVSVLPVVPRRGRLTACDSSFVLGRVGRTVPQPVPSSTNMMRLMRPLFHHKYY